jgi:CheY-like chemotaxis protein
LAAGFHRYLTKPIKVDEFMEALDRALDAKRTEESKAGKMEIGR